MTTPMEKHLAEHQVLQKEYEANAIAGMKKHRISVNEVFNRITAENEYLATTSLSFSDVTCKLEASSPNVFEAISKVAQFADKLVKGLI